MKLLLDTHVILWALSDSNYLPLDIKELICDENNEIYVSAVSLWEIAIKHKKSPKLMPYTAIQIRDYCQRAGYYFLSLNIDNISIYDKKDFNLHKDPFDHMLLAQSESNNMKLITHDKILADYNIGFVKTF